MSFDKLKNYLTSLLRRLQVQTLPHSNPPIGKIQRKAVKAVGKRVIYLLRNAQTKV